MTSYVCFPRTEIRLDSTLMQGSSILVLLNRTDSWSLGKKTMMEKILLLLNGHPFILLGDDDWYFYRASSGIPSGQWLQLEASLCLKQNSGTMTKKGRKFCVQIKLQHAVLSWFNKATFTQPKAVHFIYLSGFFFWLGETGHLKTQPGHDPYRSQHSAVHKVFHFPKRFVLVPRLQRALEKVEISPSTPHPVPIYTGGKQSNVVHIIW